MKKKKVTVVLSLGAAALLLIGGISVYAVSYTHLDVYKRQGGKRRTDPALFPDRRL